MKLILCHGNFKVRIEKSLSLLLFHQELLKQKTKPGYILYPNGTPEAKCFTENKPVNTGLFSVKHLASGVPF
jgi:hypothetical protein